MRRRTAGKGRAPRIHLELFLSTERECPEFNYKDLVHQEEKKKEAEIEKKKGGAPNGIWDAFSDNDEDVEKIAKQFEQKYGSSSTYGRSKGRNKQDDYADIGAGYDENDSFIDNTDGYDEIIPPECDTACGGFYINSGSLEFKNVSGVGPSTGDGGGGDSSPAHKTKSNKRPLSSSESEEESSSSDEESEGSVIEKNVDTEAKEAKANSVTDSDKSGEDRKKSTSEKLKDELPRKKRKSSLEGSTSSGQETATMKPPKESAEIRTNVSVVESNNNEGSTDSHSSDSSKPQVVPSSDNHASSDSSRDTASATSITPPTPAPLLMPTDLSPETMLLVKRLKTLSDLHFAAHTGKLSGIEVNDIILGLEMQCKRGKVSPRYRHAVFGYAAQLLRRGKAGLLQRARRLAEDHQRNTIASSPIDKLKNIIEKMKPTLLEQYRVEAQKIVEINKKIANHNATQEDANKLQERRLPKRRFPWNDQVRSVLQEILQNRGMDIEDGKEAMQFLQTSVLPMFPPGFVRMPTLLQQVRNAKLSKAVDAVKKAKQPNAATIVAKPVKSASENADQETPQELAKVPDGALIKSDRVLSVAIERINVNMIDSDKPESFKVQSDNVTSSQTLPNNVSISITSVFPQKCDSEKTASSPKVIAPVTPVESVIMKPFSDVPKENLQSPPKSADPLNVSPGAIASSVIKSVESVCPNQSVGSIKVKPPSSLFDKTTIAKIISGKNTDVPPNKTPEQIQAPDKVFSKPNIQDCSHLLKRKSTNLPSPTQAKQDFVKPIHKPDYRNSVHHKYDSNLNGNKQKEVPATLQSEQNHSFLKPSSSKATEHPHIHTIQADNNSSHAATVQRIVKKADDFDVYNSKIALKTANYAYKKLPKTSPPVLSLDDSSSDDCIEILTDEEGVIKQPMPPKLPEDIKNYNKYAQFFGVKEEMKNLPEVNVDYMKNKSNKWYYNMLNNPQFMSNDIGSKSSGAKKVHYSRSFSEPDHKKSKSDSDSKSDSKAQSEGCDERTPKISVRNDSVIKDAIKSDRIIDIVPDKSSNLLNIEKDVVNNEKDNMDQEDFNRVMQDLKELQDLQMQGAHQRLYDDSANS